MDRLRLLRGAPAVWALNAALAAGAIALYRHVGALPAPVGAMQIPWWGLVAAFALTEFAVVHVHFRRGAHTLTLAELPLALGLLFSAPAHVMIGWVAGAGLVLALNRSLPRKRLVFNLGQLGVTAGVAASLFHAVSGPAADGGPRVWAAVLASVLVAAAVSVALVGAAMWLSGDRIRMRRLAEMVAMGASVAGINASLGLAAGSVILTDPRAAVLLLAPAAAVFVAYRAYTSERRNHKNMEFLHEASRTLARAPDPAAGLAGLLATALETFRCEVAAVALFPAAGEEEGRRIAVGTADRLDVMQPLDQQVARQLSELIAADPGVRLIAPDSAVGALAAHVTRLGEHEAMLAPLQAEQVIGVMVLANRLGTGAAGFGRADVALFETLVRQTGAELGQDRLGRKLSELKGLHVELERQAFHDPLTGLANRLLFMNRAEHALKRRTGNAAVIYIDLDNFKPINDTYGHEAGDAVLIGAADRLRESLRPADTAARLGGDEFAVLLIDIPEEHIGVVADRIVRKLTKPLEVAGGRELTIGASLGVAAAASGTLGADDLVRNADVAMYVAKHGGKGRLSVFEQPAPAAA
jgi:diguanylate cyclase (GGDEF)-like protein